LLGGASESYTSSASGNSVRARKAVLTNRLSVTRILVMTETLSLSSVKAHLSELVDRVEDQHDRVLVTRNGKPAAVLVSYDDLESLEETLAIMSDPALMAQIRESERTDTTTDPSATLGELRARLHSRRDAAG
jgi:antitoxin YefM